MMTNSDREHLLWRIADATGAMERNYQRMVGAAWRESYEADWDTTTRTYLMLLAAHKPAVHLPARMVTGRGA